jgi:hypothetical protein
MDYSGQWAMPGSDQVHDAMQSQFVRRKRATPLPKKQFLEIHVVLIGFPSLLFFNIHNEKQMVILSVNDI